MLPERSHLSVDIVPIGLEDADGYRCVVKSVAAEHAHIGMAGPPSLERTRALIQSSLDLGYPHLVAFDDVAIVGWCEVPPTDSDGLHDTGILNMGLLAPYRGQGLGERLLREALVRGAGFGYRRVALTVHVRNAAALALYRKLGFQASLQGVAEAGDHSDASPFSMMSLSLPATR